jgi:DNA-binding MurR/RpiR family transcriptional regulator
MSRPVADTTDPHERHDLLRRIQGVSKDLSPAERRVTQVIAKMPPEQLVFANAEELGRLTGTSDATVVRTARRLGYSGLPELKRAVGESLVPRPTDSEIVTRRLANLPGDVTELVGRIVSDAQESLELTAHAADAGPLQAAFELLARADTVVGFGYGGTELPARHLVRALSRLGFRAWYAGSTGFMLADDLIRIRSGDTVVVFQPGRRLHDLDVLINHAKAAGASVVLVSDTKLADHYRERVDVSLLAMRSQGHLSAEALPSLLIADVLVSGMALLDEGRVTSTRAEFTELRNQIIEG